MTLVLTLVLKATVLLLAILIGGWPQPAPAPITPGWRIALCGLLCILFVWLVSGGM